MRKNLAVDIPVDAETEVQRIRGLKKSIFTRTRIALLCLVMVVALSIAGTWAYENAKFTGNATPNRTQEGEIELTIVESVNGGAEVEDTDGTNVPFTAEGKKVKIKAGTDMNRANEVVHVSFVPQVEVDPDTIDVTSATGTANVHFGETWSEIKTVDGVKCIETDLVRLILNESELGNWTYSNGTFTYNTALKRGESTGYLLKGVVLKDGVTRSDYKDIKVAVIAEGVQENAEDVIKAWKGITS